MGLYNLGIMLKIVDVASEIVDVASNVGNLLKILWSNVRGAFAVMKTKVRLCLKYFSFF